MEYIKGQIIKNISNKYTVKANEKYYEAIPRGKFKNEEITPVVGDYVKINPIEESTKTAGSEEVALKTEVIEANTAETAAIETAVIEEICPRTVYIKRPKLANITQIVLVVSSKDPKPDLLLLDKQLAFAEYLHIKSVIVLNKIDLDKKQEFQKIKSIYEEIGYTVIETQAKKQIRSSRIKASIKRKHQCIFWKFRSTENQH